jgi:hypothetical protein
MAGRRAGSGNPGERCAGRNRRGEPCTSVALVEGFCGYHAGFLVLELRARIAELERVELREISLEEFGAEPERASWRTCALGSDRRTPTRFTVQSEDGPATTRIDLAHPAVATSAYNDAEASAKASSVSLARAC